MVRTSLTWMLPVLGETHVPSDIVITAVSKERRDELAAGRMSNDGDNLPALGGIRRGEER